MGALDSADVADKKACDLESAESEMLRGESVGFPGSHFRPNSFTCIAANRTS